MFRDVSVEAGVVFRHINGATGKYRFIESTGGGCAFFDFDNDGYLDIFLLQSGYLPEDKKPLLPNALFKNNGDGTFTDVTKGSGLEFTGYGQGVAVGDYDNDGYEDLYITTYTGFSECRLFKNLNGTGKFLDVTKKAGVSDKDKGPRWATSAAFGDYNKDGWLDLYVCHYAKWTPQTDKRCFNIRNEQAYCSPEIYDGDTDRLYRNNGNGSFTDVTEEAGISKESYRGLGVAWFDFDKDGWVDIYVANDLHPNLLFKNNGNGTFTDVAVEAGVAYSDTGVPLAGMGVGISDYDNDGWEDILVVNFSGEPDNLYRNNGDGTFDDVSYLSGLATPSLNFLAFGCEFFDYDADGLRDIIMANGHVDDKVHRSTKSITYKEPKELFRNRGDGTFEKVTKGLGDLTVPVVSRGLAVGDYDNDGRLDVLACNQNDLAQLFHNEARSKNHFISFKLVGTKSNRSGAHTKITLRAGGRIYFAEVRAGSSYCSHSDRRAYFGLGKTSKVDDVVLQWLSGAEDRLKNLKADRIYVVTEGKGVTKTTPDD